VLDGGAILRIWAEESGVGAVERGHNLRGAGADHFLGKKRSCRVRHRVMDMKKIEPVGLADLRHFYSKRQCVIGTGKDGGVPDFDLMKANPRQRKIEPNWFRVAEKMNLVTVRGQFRSERGCENAAAANERKTNDPDFERQWHL